MCRASLIQNVYAVLLCAYFQFTFLSSLRVFFLRFVPFVTIVNRDVVGILFCTRVCVRLWRFVMNTNTQSRVYVHASAGVCFFCFESKYLAWNYAWAPDLTCTVSGRPNQTTVVFVRFFLFKRFSRIYHAETQKIPVCAHSAHIEFLAVFWQLNTWNGWILMLSGNFLLGEHSIQLFHASLTIYNPLKFNIRNENMRTHRSGSDHNTNACSIHYFLATWRRAHQMFTRTLI